MKALERNLQSVVKSLKALTQKTEKIAKILDRLEKARPVKKPRGKVRVKAKPSKKRVTRKVTVKKRIKVTASDTVMGIIKGSRTGVDSATLQRQTGFNNQKIRSNVFKLTKQGKIKRVGRGVYIAKKIYKVNCL